MILRVVSKRYASLASSSARCARIPYSRTFCVFSKLEDSPPKGDAPESHSLQKESRTSQISRALKEASSNNLLAPVHIPEDPHGILNERHPATSLLSHSALVVTREMEMMNVMLGYEEANKYVIMDAQGNHLGFMAEEDRGMGRMMARQMLRTHRQFTTHIFDRHMKEILRFHRPFSYINSTIGVYDPLEPDARVNSSSTALQPEAVQAGQVATQTSQLALSDMRLIGEAKQVWAPMRRKYDIFLARPPEPEDPSFVFEQFARVDERFLSWDFGLRDTNGALIGSVTRNFTNFGREIFTDAGVYALRMDAAAPENANVPAKSGASEVLGTTHAMTLDQRAVMLATAVTVDYDYFSRERGGMFGMPIPLWLPGMGGEAAGGAGAAEAGAAGAAGEAGAAGAGSEAVGTAAGGAVRGAGAATGMGESAATGAGTMAAYEAMQRAREGQAPDEAAPTAESHPPGQAPPGQPSPPEELSWWEQDQQQQREQDPSGWGGGDQNGDGGGDGGDWGDLF